MPDAKYSDSLRTLIQNEEGVLVPNLCRDHGMSSAQFNNW